MSKQIFYHADLDGQCSAAIVNFFYGTADEVIHFHPVVHNKPFPIEKIQKNDEVWILDYSTSPEIMDKIFELTDKIYWIDHHKSAIEKFEDYDKEIPGIRLVGLSGCQLTWKFIVAQCNYIPEIRWKFRIYLEEDSTGIVPEFIHMIGLFDTWKWKELGDIEKEAIKYFTVGMNAEDTTPLSDIWNELFNDTEVTIERVINNAPVIDKFLFKYHQERLEAYGFEAKLDGHDCLVMNDRGDSSIFAELEEKYPILSTFIWDGEKFYCSVYSKVNNAREIALNMNAKYGLGGGGHDGAAGFNTPEIPYTDMKPINWEKWQG